MRRITAADGTPDEPLPTEVPTDADHLVNPRDRRAERLAAEQIKKITESNDI